MATRHAFRQILTGLASGSLIALLAAPAATAAGLTSGGCGPEVSGNGIRYTACIVLDAEGYAAGETRLSGRAEKSCWVRYVIRDMTTGKVAKSHFTEGAVRPRVLKAHPVPGHSYRLEVWVEPWGAPATKASVSPTLKG
jgi:hypothetical protein